MSNRGAAAFPAPGATADAANQARKHSRVSCDSKETNRRCSRRVTSSTRRVALMTNDPWRELEERLVQLNELTMPAHAAMTKARLTIADVRSGSGGRIERVEFKGPATFLRVVGMNRVYGGEWWFEKSLLEKLDQAYSRVFFSHDKAQAVRAILREALALSFTKNRMTEIWALELPAGEVLVGYKSRAASQSLFWGLPVSAANRMLVGGANQIFFPVKNPLWVKQYGTLS